jgi:hypothetical protein
MLEQHIRTAGLRVEVIGVWGGGIFTVYGDGTAAGRAHVREVIADGLRAQSEPAEVVFEDEKATRT